MITFDAARLDFFPRVCGNLRGKPTSMPNLEKLCRSGRVFLNAYSPSPNTAMAMASLYTGYSPIHHRMKPARPLHPPGILTLAEALRSRNYSTILVSGNQGYLHPLTLIPRGFESIGQNRKDDKFSNFFDPYNVVRVAHYQARKLCRSRCFIHVHFMQPHTPYGGPYRYFDRYPGKDLSFIPAEEIEAWKLQFVAASHLPPQKVQRILEHYRAGLRWADDALGWFVNAITQVFPQKSLMFLVSSDHGEAFGEHRYWTHNDTVYEEMVHIPFIVSGSGINPGTDSRLVTLEDVFNTFLDLANIHSQQRPFSSIPFLSGKSSRTPQNQRQFALLMAANLYHGPIALLFKNYKYIYWRDEKYSELYDLRIDPQEKNNIIETQYPLAKKLHNTISLYITKLYKPINNPLKANLLELDSLEQEFKALGYIGVDTQHVPAQFNLRPPNDKQKLQQ